MNHNFRSYRNSKLVIEETTSGEYCIRVDYLPRSIRHLAPGVSQVVTNNNDFSYIHTTSPSQTKEEAMAKAEGYVDCLNHFYNYQTDTNKNKDFCKEKYKENLKWHKENPDDQDKNSSVSDRELELAYKEGWDKKFSELKNDGDVGV